MIKRFTLVVAFGGFCIGTFYSCGNEESEEVEVKKEEPVVGNEEEEECEDAMCEQCEDAKPIIYLYPEKETKVEVSLDYKGELTHTYPKYHEKWEVTARPDGTLYDEFGKEYYALYWEGKSVDQYTIDEGFVIPGEETADFLESSLEILGLNRKEANEFIVYWLPKLENNPYNLIHFSTSEYEEKAKLTVNPKPETMIRVMMVYSPLDEYVSVPAQDLNAIGKERKGFTLVEWGGSLWQSPVEL